MTDATQFRAGAIVYFTARQNLVCDVRDQTIEVGRDFLNQTPKHWRRIAFGENRSARRHRLFAQYGKREDRRRLGGPRLQLAKVRFVPWVLPAQKSSRPRRAF